MERREAYRSDPGGDGGLCVWLSVEGQEHRLEVVNITSGGCALLIPCTMTFPLEVDSVLSIRLEAAAMPPLVVESRVVHVQDESVFRVCGLAFQLDGRPMAVPADLGALFNRRRNVRVQPAETDVFSVRIEDGPEVAVRARILDISESGMGIVVEDDRAPGLDGRESLQIQFQLPTCDRPLTLEACVRHGSRCETGFRYGLEFVPAEGPAFEFARHAIVAYVIRRLQAHFREHVET